MVWVVDKKVVRHVIEREGQFVEVPVRVSFEYESDEGKLVEGTLEMKTLYNEKSIAKVFPSIDMDALDAEIQETVKRDVTEYIAMGSRS